MFIDIKDLELIAEELSSDLAFYENKKIFITGGTGFFGKWLLETIAYLNDYYRLNLSATILSRSPEKFTKEFPLIANHGCFSFVKGDVRNFPDVNEEFDYIIHAGTDASPELNKANPELMRSTIMDGTKRVCELAYKVNCKRILYTSSGAAYGPQPENLTRMPETFVDNRLFDYNDAYASSKLDSEKYFIEHAVCDVVIARCFAFAGPYLPLNGSYAFGNFINDVLHNREISIKSSGDDLRSYLYAADLIIWLLRILSSGISGEIYNVGSEKTISIFKLAKKISQGSVGVKILGLPSGSRNIYVPSVEKTTMSLGLEQYTSLDDSIAKMIRFYKLEH